MSAFASVIDGKGKVSLVLAVSCKSDDEEEPPKLRELCCARRRVKDKESQSGRWINDSELLEK